MTEQGRNVAIDECPACGNWIGFYAAETERAIALASNGADIDAAGVTCLKCGALVLPADKIPGVIPTDCAPPLIPRTARLMLRPSSIDPIAIPTKSPDGGEIEG